MFLYLLVKSKTYKKLINDVAEELNLPANLVDDAIKSAYRSLLEEIRSMKPKEVFTHDDYDKLQEKISMQYIGAFHKIKEKQILKIRQYYDKEERI